MVLQQDPLVLIEVPVIIFKAELVGMVLVEEEQLVILLMAAVDVVDVDVCLLTGVVVVHLVIPPVRTTARHRVNDGRHGVAGAIAQVTSELLLLFVAAVLAYRALPALRLAYPRAVLADEVVAFVHQHTLVVLTAVSLNLLVARDALKGSVVGVVDSGHRVGLLLAFGFVGLLNVE